MAKGKRKKTGLKKRLEVAEHNLRVQSVAFQNCSLAATALTRASASGGNPTVLIVRSGGLGDNVQGTFIARAIRSMFPDAYICQMLRFDGGYSMLLRDAQKQDGTRPIVNGWIETLQSINHASVVEMFKDSFSAIVDLRYIPRLYVSDYARSRSEALDSWYNETQGIWELDRYYQRLHEEYPYSNNAFVKLRKNLLALQFSRLALPWTDKLTLARPDISSYLNVLGLQAGDYVTLATGAGGGAIRKEYPVERSPLGPGNEGGWIPVLKHLRRMGVKVLQVGKPTDGKAPPAYAIDMRGQLEFNHVLGLVAGARFHMGIEGGLIHFARCFNTPCLVAHGPTGKTVFGYHDNVNCGDEVCLECFWRTPKWHEQKCPRGFTHCENFPACDELCDGVDALMDRTETASIDKPITETSLIKAIA